MKFTDFEGREIQLKEGVADEGREHIKEEHSEITVDEIKRTLENPDEIRESKHTTPTRCQKVLYYRSRTTNPDRLTEVVVKWCSDGSWITTAMTVNKMKSGKTIFKRESK